MDDSNPKIITKCNNFSQGGFDPKNYYRGIRTQKVLQGDSNPKSITGKIRTQKVLQSVILFLKRDMSPKSITGNPSKLSQFARI